ncbi:hypothetical protein LPJ78_003299 [Coemansia sp. RSA 989]|nr:hypothetical protein LPJ68_005323 [Coemansia sp. RSA 1086]KAJ1864563.1 hypothetical protein LPJ78_003299 [Coemansia sp. RSA 989]KAJ2671891.1 hypothetical protein IWW42_003153 [Coemansia sp. RSA 1085]
MLFESQLPDVKIPNTNLVSYILSECKRRSSANHPVFVDSETQESITVDQLEQYTRKFARVLQAYGVEKGQVVAVFANNSILYPIVAFGIVALGAICAPINPMYTARELSHHLETSNSRVVVVGDGLHAVARQAITDKHTMLFMDEGHSGVDNSVFDILQAPLDPGSGWAGDEDYSQLPAYLCFSSGTTGKPKGVVLTHKNMIANAMQINRIKQLDVPTMNNHPYETYLGLAPFCHAYGLSYVLHSSVALGGRIIVMRKYSFVSFLQTIQQHRVTFGYLVPPLVCALSKDERVERFDLSSMHTILSGGAALSASLIEATEERLKGTRVIQGYGMSEMSPAITMLSTSHSKPGSIGLLLPNCQAKVLDDCGRPLAANQQGELCFRGPNVMPCYLNNPAATADIFDQDRFLHTGDIGYVDAHGFFYITDRKKEIIKFKGFQVAPSELESLLAEHPDIEDAAVMPVYDVNQATEIPRGYFVLKPSSAEDELERGQRIVDWLHERVAKYKKLRGGFVIVDNIPRSPAGKIIRGSLRSMEQIESRESSSSSSNI